MKLDWIFSKPIVVTGLLAAATASFQLLSPVPAHAIVPVCAATQSPIPSIDPNFSCLATDANNKTWELRAVQGAFGDGTNVNGVDLTKNPWWGRPSSIADNFAGLVGAGLGATNAITTIRRFGPNFAYSLVSSSAVNRVACAFNTGFPPCATQTLQAATNFPGSYWAYAVDRSVSVPGPLPVLGTAAAFGFSRKLRKRIKASRSAVPTVTSG